MSTLEFDVTFTLSRPGTSNARFECLELLVRGVRESQFSKNGDASLLLKLGEVGVGSS